MYYSKHRSIPEAQHRSKTGRSALHNSPTHSHQDADPALASATGSAIASTAHPLLQLQRQYGNQSVQQMVQGSSQSIQARSNKRLTEIQKAVRWYKTTRTGRKIQYTDGLVNELYKVAGSAHEHLRTQALAEGVLGESFVRLVMEAQKNLRPHYKGKIDGKIGSKTIAAWNIWKTGGKKGIDYRRLLDDKKLEIGIAIGDEFHDSEYKEMVKFLGQEGFALVHDSVTKRTYSIKKTVLVPGDNTAAPVEIEIIIDIISSKSQSSKQTFGTFLTDREITIYSGHARYGTGPDFDSKKSPAENFVIGVNSALHKAGRLKQGYNAEMNKIIKQRKNDLEELSRSGQFSQDKYQVWFFNACTSLHYLDEVRGGLVQDPSGKTKSRDNLRFFGTKKSIVSDAMPILKGLLKIQTMPEIIAAMNKYETGKSDAGIFFAD